ncbi:MAG: hypothetical protein AAF394_00025 [Planctomycetota bacterium]
MNHRLQKQKANLKAHEINRWNRVAEAAMRGELVPELPNGAIYNPNSRTVFVENTTGSDREAGECMAITGMAWDLEPDTRVGLLFELGVAVEDKPPAILVNDVEAGQVGLAVVDGMALALVEGDASNKQFGIPNAATHSIAPASSGGIKILTEPHDTDQKLLAVVLNAGEGGAELFYYQLTTDMAVSGHLLAKGEATGTLSPLNGSGSSQPGQTVFDYTGTAAHQVSGDKGLALKAGSEFIVIEPECNFENFNPNDPGPGPA